jgi:hypothetical protein
MIAQTPNVARPKDALGVKPIPRKLPLNSRSPGTNVDPAPPHPLILRARCDDIGIIKEKFEVVSRVCDRAGAPYDQEIDVTLSKFPVQCLRVCGDTCLPISAM